MLQEANEELSDKAKDIQRELEESTAEMNKMADEYTKLKVQYLHLTKILSIYSPHSAQSQNIQFCAAHNVA